MLRDGLRPAAALRAAQTALAQNPKWAAPYYWAGFVLQGEWR
jgi:CHAT domain-containing protein